MYLLAATVGLFTADNSILLEAVLVALVFIVLLAVDALRKVRSDQLKVAKEQLDLERKEHERSTHRASAQPGELEGLVRKLSSELAEANERSRKQDDQLRQQAETLKAQQEQMRQQALQMQQQHAQIGVLQARIQELETQLARYLPKPANSAQPALLVGVGPEAGLDVDLTALREVQRKSNGCFRFTRLLPVSFENLKNSLARRREAGNPIRNVHLAVHAGEDGVIFTDGLVSGVRLSEVLQDVDVLLLAGCEADQVGDLLGVVASVITLREAVPMGDARAMTTVFWGAIAEGLDAAAAFERVLERCPAISEYIELHQ